VPKVSGGGGVTQDDITEERAGVVLSLRVTLPYLDHDSNFPAIYTWWPSYVHQCMLVF
jgi:hypothetical protein